MIPRLSESELILNNDGSIYHLALKPDEIGDTIILVGDPERVPMVSRHFEEIVLIKEKREFLTHTGTLRSQKISVISTGIGTDNIDIVINELDALANIDFHNRELKNIHKQLKFIRLGTCGSIEPNCHPGEIIISEYAIGMDNLMHFYKSNNENSEAKIWLSENTSLLIPELKIQPYIVKRSLKSEFEFKRGITLTAPGFYGPQGRTLRGESVFPDLIDRISSFTEFENLKVTNLEMETSGIYGLASLLGHQALSISLILASRHHKSFSDNPLQLMNNMIISVLNKL